MIRMSDRWVNWDIWVGSIYKDYIIGLLYTFLFNIKWDIITDQKVNLMHIYFIFKVLSSNSAYKFSPSDPRQVYVNWKKCFQLKEKPNIATVEQLTKSMVRSVFGLVNAIDILVSLRQSRQRFSHFYSVAEVQNFNLTLP